MKISKLLVGVFGSVLVATSAIAADLPLAPTVIAPPPPPSMAAPAFDWSGMYYGLHVTSIFEIGAHVGFNVDRGRMILGVEAGASVVPFGPVFTAYVKGRAGVAVRERVLLYAMASVDAAFAAPVQFLWVAGGGAEFALNDRISLYVEAGALGLVGPFACCGLSLAAGLNIHR